MKPSYSELLKDPRWQKIRLLVLERDRWECTYCGDKERTLHVHHTKYRYGAKPWEYEPDSLKTLCVDCHEEQTKWDRLAKGILDDLDSSDLARVVGYVNAIRSLPDSLPITVIDSQHSQGVADYIGFVTEEEVQENAPDLSGLEIDGGNRRIDFRRQLMRARSRG